MSLSVAAAGRPCSCTCFVVPVGHLELFDQDDIRKLQLLSHVDINMVKTKSTGISVDPEARPVELSVMHHACFQHL